MKTEIRLAKPQDAAELLEIYAFYDQETAVSFEYQVPELEEFRSRVEQVLQQYPYLVYLADEKIVGFAYAHKQLERAAYQWNVELSVYVHHNFLRRGIGRALYGALLELLTLQGVRNAYGLVTSPNRSSEKLHKSFGFQLLAIHRRTGYKMGQWHDVSWFEKSLNSHGKEPEALIPVSGLDVNRVQFILNQYGNTPIK